MGRLDCQHEALSPAGGGSRLVVQPHSIALAGAMEIQVAPVSDLPTSETGASIFLPFWPWPIRPFEGGLVSAADRHSNTERKFANVGKGVGEIRNV